MKERGGVWGGVVATREMGEIRREEQWRSTAR